MTQNNSGGADVQRVGNLLSSQCYKMNQQFYRVNDKNSMKAATTDHSKRGSIGSTNLGPQKPNQMGT